MLARSTFSPHYWWAWIGVYGLFVGFGVLAALSRHQQSVLVLVVIVVLCGVILSLAMIHDARIDAKRQAAFQHLAQAPTIPIQVYELGAMTLPLRLLWRPTWRGIAALIGMIGVLTIVLVVLMSVISKAPSHVYLSLNIWGGSLLFAGVFVEGLGAFTFYAVRPVFSVWAKGIAVGWRRYLDYSSLLLWKNVKFFAVRATANGAPTLYEMSGEHQTIIFGRLRSGSLAAFFFRPPMPFAEYDALMDSLVAYIADRTKLPLVDLAQM